MIFLTHNGILCMTHLYCSNLNNTCSGCSFVFWNHLLFIFASGWRVCQFFPQEITFPYFLIQLLTKIYCIWGHLNLREHILWLHDHKTIFLNLNTSSWPPLILFQNPLNQPVLHKLYNILTGSKLCMTDMLPLQIMTHENCFHLPTIEIYMVTSGF